MKKFIIVAVFLSVLSFCVSAQNKNISGQVSGTDGSPIEGARISFSNGITSVVTDKNGSYEFTIPNDKGFLKIVADGFYDKEFPLNNKDLPSKFVLVSKKEVKYNGFLQMNEYTETRDLKSAILQGVENKDLKKGFILDNSIQDEVPGLFVSRKSGMPGEGSYMNIRGIHSIVAENAPLFVVNGVPYFGNNDISNTIKGYSRSLLFGYNTQDVRSVTVLKGADASQYGSLGSNGVILIETEQATSDNLETRISFSGQYGVSLPNRTIPVMNPSDFKTYLQDLGMTRYDKITTLHTDYPFLENTDNKYSYLFNNNTNWINEVQSPSFLTDNVFRVEGGDEIAKYNISFGYGSEGGILGKTHSDRYHTLINSNIMVRRDLDIFTNVGLYYINGEYQEQGITSATNAILSSYLTMPVLSPFKKEPNGNILNTYSTYNGWNVNSNPFFPYDNISNSVAIVNTIEASDKIYDANIRFGLNYRANRYLTVTGLLNMYYNYTEESIFIPGVTNHAIIPQYFNTGLNTVRKGVIENTTNYYALNATYKRTFDGIHQVNALMGARYINKNLEYDLASGYNTANDFYETLGGVTDDKDIDGSNNEWKWLNYNMHADYIFNHLLKSSFNLSVDGTSVSGINTDRFGVFPSLSLTFMSANTGLLPEYISLLNISAEVSRTGNSQFSSNYAKNYYYNSNFFNLGTIIRSNVPNTKLSWEKKDQVDLGFDFSALNNKLNLQFNYFFAKSFHLLIAREISSIYGSGNYYDNVGEIGTKGFETSIRFNPVKTKDFDWSFGVSFSKSSSIVNSLGDSKDLATTFESFNGDDAIIMLSEGKSPYQFYGYKTNGIYTTSTQASEAGLINIYGNPYLAGDIRFEDVYEDGIINEKDKVLLGSSTPDFFGSFNSYFRYKNVSLLAEFGFVVGNKAYNAVRRQTESMKYFHNQSESVMNRWQMEGQITDMPRASYGDPSGNSIFSDRWIEDASYCKLRSMTISYHFNESLFRVIRSGSIFLVGENLFTMTNYLGGDPEFSYSNDEFMQGFDYGKVILPVNVKLGINLNF